MTEEEETEYLSLDETAKAVGLKKGSLYYYLKALGIKTRKFPLNRHAYITRKEAKRIQDAIINPWKIDSETESRDQAEDAA